MFDMTARRLNLSLPAHFDALLDELAALSGRSKSSYVLDAVTSKARHWRDEVNRLNGVVGRQEVAPSTDDTESVEQAPAEMPVLSRQQRRQFERYKRKQEAKN